MLKLKVLSAFAAVLSLASCGASGDSLDALRSGFQVKIVNDSRLAIHEIYLSRTYEDWGMDRLGLRTLEPGYQLKINTLAAGRYDLMLVDEDGDVCDIRDMSISGDRTVTIDTHALLRCERSS